MKYSKEAVEKITSQLKQNRELVEFETVLAIKMFELLLIHADNKKASEDLDAWLEKRMKGAVDICNKMFESCREQEKKNES